MPNLQRRSGGLVLAGETKIGVMGFWFGGFWWVSVRFLVRFVRLLVGFGGALVLQRLFLGQKGGVLSSSVWLL